MNVSKNIFIWVPSFFFFIGYIYMLLIGNVGGTGRVRRENGTIRMAKRLVTRIDIVQPLALHDMPLALSASRQAGAFSWKRKRSASALNSRVRAEDLPTVHEKASHPPAKAEKKEAVAGTANKEGTKASANKEGTKATNLRGKKKKRGGKVKKEG